MVIYYPIKIKVRKQLILKKLKEYPKDLYVLTITIISFVIFIILNQLVFPLLSQSSSGYGILDFEFAWTTERVLEIFTVWGTNGIQLVTLETYWDMLYIIGYGFFIFGCILLVSRRLEGRLQDIGINISLTPLIAGIFDFIENLQLLAMLGNPASFPPFSPLVAGVSAFIKFTLLIIGIAFFFITLIIVVIILIREKSNN